MSRGKPAFSPGPRGLARARKDRRGAVLAVFVPRHATLRKGSSILPDLLSRAKQSARREGTMMRRVDKVVWVALLVFGCLCLGTPLAAQTPSFQILATPSAWGLNVEAVGVSADGKVIIGKYFLSGTDPACNTFGGCTRTFRWTLATGVVDLGVLDATEAEAHALSADGSLIVGEASSRVAFRRAFIWTAATGMQDLGTPLVPNGPDFSVSRAFGISSTGSVIVGEAIPTQTSPQPNLIPQSFRFTTAAGFAF